MLTDKVFVALVDHDRVEHVDLRLVHQEGFEKYSHNSCSLTQHEKSSVDPGAATFVEY